MPIRNHWLETKKCSVSWVPWHALICSALQTGGLSSVATAMLNIWSCSTSHISFSSSKPLVSPWQGSESPPDTILTSLIRHWGSCIQWKQLNASGSLKTVLGICLCIIFCLRSRPSWPAFVHGDGYHHPGGNIIRPTANHYGNHMTRWIPHPSSSEFYEFGFGGLSLSPANSPKESALDASFGGISCWTSDAVATSYDHGNGLRAWDALGRKTRTAPQCCRCRLMHDIAWWHYQFFKPFWLALVRFFNLLSFLRMCGVGRCCDTNSCCLVILLVG